jgi:hypothetical protein
MSSQAAELILDPIVALVGVVRGKEDTPRLAGVLQLLER